MKYTLKSDRKYNPFMSNDIRDLIFYNREIEDIVSYVSPKRDYLLDPFLLDNMKEAVFLLEHHIKQCDPIFIVVDSDVDGYTSASILYNYLTERNGSLKTISWMVHSNKAHGINLDLVPEDTKLIICPDSSSNEYEKHKILQQKGIDVLVLDHHEAPEYSQYATVVNNKMSVNYPNKDLSGAGVVYKFCQACDILGGFNKCDDYLDLAALGIISDMCDVRPLENRYIISEGLKNINNPFLKELIKKQEFSLGNHAINAVGIMFYIAPLINAVTRVGTLEERQIMFEALINGYKHLDSTKRGAKAGDKETVAEQAVRFANNARNRQKKIVDEIKQTIEEDLEQQDLTTAPLIMVKLASISNRNLTGLIANQLASKYKRPVLLLVDQNDGSLAGSGRNYNFHEVDNLKECLQDSKSFEFAEGHQSAFGAKILEENVEDFMSKLDEIMPDMDGIDDSFVVDFVFDGKDFTVDMIREITKLRSLWGKGFDEPLIAVTGIPVNIQNFQLMGKYQTHLKFTYNNITYVKFWASEEQIADFKDKDIIVDVVGRADVNIWNDNFTYQVIVQDYAITGEGAEFGF